MRLATAPQHRPRRRPQRLGRDAGRALDSYDTRFHIGLSPQEKADLLAFLNAL